MSHAALRWLNGCGDALIALSCCALSLWLLRLSQRRIDLPTAVLGPLTVFLLLLAMVHILGLWSLWYAVPAWLALTKSLTAFAAVVTTALLWRYLPHILTLPTREQSSSAQATVQAAHQELESFVSSVSHDLRAPLTSIAGQAGLLELSLGANLSDDIRRRLQRIHQSVRHMSALIEAAVAFSRIARHELRPEALDISALAQSIIDELHRKDPQRAVKVVIEPGLQAHGDKHLVTDLLAHVLGNAWKFTARATEPSIEIGACRETQPASLYVRDNGAGFDMTYEPKLFKPFQRLHSPSEFEGAGLGLASAARIVARHGGKIWTKAQPNAGAVFYFTLPHEPWTSGA